MCLLCQRIKKLKSKEDSRFIKEFKHSYLILGDHQFFKGYSVVLLKDHIPDLVDLDPLTQAEYLSEVMTSAKAIKKTFKPYKLNYAVLGNEVEHVHFHLFPRYEEELKKEKVKHPWQNSDKFHEFVAGESEVSSRVKLIQQNL